MKVSDYMPELYKNNLEMNNIINNEEAEFENNLKANIDNSFLNTFINTANEIGIEQYEELFNIKPNIETDTLEFRKQRILSRLISQLPYTERYMINKLNEILGEDNWNYTLDYNNYSLVINSTIPGKSWLNELYDFLNRTIPCNIEYEVIIYAATWQLVSDNFNTWNDIENTEMTWQELADAEWLI